MAVAFESLSSRTADPNHRASRPAQGVRVHGQSRRRRWGDCLSLDGRDEARFGWIVYLS